MNWKLVVVLVIVSGGLLFAPQASAEEEPIVIYSLQFLELDDSMSNQLKTEIDLNEGTQTNNQWHISSKEEVLSQFQSGTVRADLTADIETRTDKTRLYYNSWLTTVGKQPVSLEVGTELIARDGEENNSYLQFEFDPTKINAETKEISTDIKFDYQNKNGNRAQVETNQLVGETSDEPLAIVTKEVTSSQEAEYKHLALYLTSRLVFPETISDQASMIAAGNMGGVDKLQSEEINSVPPQLSTNQKKLGVYGGYKTAGGQFDWQKNRWNWQNKVTYTTGKVAYKTSLNYRLNQQEPFTLTGVVENKTSGGDETALRLGLKDKVVWNPGLSLRIGYFPFYWDLESDVDIESRVRGRIQFARSNWQLWYGADYVDDDYFNRAGIGWDYSDSWRLEGNWKESPVADNQVYLKSILNLSE